MGQNQWLIVYVIYADCKLKGFINNYKIFSELEYQLNDFKKCTINEGVKILVVINTIKFEIERDENSKKDFTVLFEVKKQNTGDNLFLMKNVQYSKPEHKIQSSTALKNVFNDINSNPEYKSTHVFLNTWDHGSVFGIFKDTGELLLPEKITNISSYKKNEFPILNELFANMKSFNHDIKECLESTRQNQNNDSYYFRRRYFFGANLDKLFNKISEFRFLDKYFHNPKLELTKTNLKNKIKVSLEKAHDKYKEFVNLSHSLSLTENNNKVEFSTDLPVEQAFDILTNNELRSAIKESFGKVDILMMMNCWMMNLDSIYTFTDVVDYLIAPPSDIDEPGYNNYEIINGINSKTTPDELSKLAISTFASSGFNNSRDKFKSNIESTCVICIEPSNFNDLFVTLKIFISELQEICEAHNEKPLMDLLIFARRFCYQLDVDGHYFLIDIFHWANLIGDTKQIIDPIIDSDIYPLFVKLNSKLKDVMPRTDYVYFHENFYSGFGEIIRYKFKNKPTGIALFFPDSKSAYQQLVETEILSNSKFNANFKNWLELLGFFQSNSFE